MGSTHGSTSKQMLLGSALAGPQALGSIGQANHHLLFSRFDMSQLAMFAVIGCILNIWGPT